MRNRITFVAIVLAAGCGAPPLARSAPPPLGTMRDVRAEHFVDSLLALLSLDEKVGQLTMAPAEGMQTGPRMPQGGAAQVRAGLIGSFIGVVGPAAAGALQRIAVDESPHHIPLLFSLDVIHGHRTIFPIPIGEAASFDSALAERDARIAAQEATADGIAWSFAPMVDIARDPRWGRIIEGAGEDPYLGEVMGAARVRGLQGHRLNDPESMLATAKHFAGYGAAEGGRDYAQADVSERTLWDVYLPPYRGAIRAGVGAVMPSFSAVAGSPPHASEWLLRDVLRGRLGFRGVIVSDWAGIEELIPHGTAATRGDAARLAMRAGVDVDMADGVYPDSLAPLVRSGAIAPALVDDAVRRVLRAKYDLGLFTDPYRGVTPERAARVILSAANREAARAAARESIVLLKNVGHTLPLSRNIRSLAVIGALANDGRSAIGAWAVRGKPGEAVTLLDGLRRANPAMDVRFAIGAQPEGSDTLEIASAVQLASDAQAVVLVLGENAERTGEAESRSRLELPLAQLELARRVTRAARGKPLVVVLMNGRPLAIPWVADSVPAIVEAWALGSEHGNAVADVLFGAYDPGGKMPVTVPRATGEVPIYYAHTNTGRPFKADDKYTSRYNDGPSTPLFPFGFGLSYTTFSVSDLRLSRDSMRAGDSLGVTVSVANTGDRDGDEVLQLYLRDDVASVAQPVRRLVRFRRVSLHPHERRTMSFTLGPEDLAFHDLRMRRVVEPGSFTLYAGSSSEATLAERFSVAGDTLVIAPAPPRMQ